MIRTVLFLLAFFAAGGLTFYFGSRKPEIYFPAMDKEKPQVLFLGDSNIDYGFEGTDIPVLLNEKTGMITYNGAVGGTCAGEPERIAKRTAYRSALNFNNLTRMMETGDFSGALRNRDFLEKNASGIENKALILGHLDYHAMDYVIVHYGLNDYMENGRGN